jgi:hypothetical protein
MEPVGFHGQSGPASSIIDHAVKHWANRTDTAPQDWISAVEAESPQRRSEAMHGLYNAASYYEQKNWYNRESLNLAKSDRELVGRLNKKISRLKLVMGGLALLGLTAIIVVFYATNNQKSR